MGAVKKVLILGMMTILAFVFWMTLTEMPTIAAGGGTYCDKGKDKYCWTSIPYWECRTVLGGVKCTDPVMQ